MLRLIQPETSANVQTDRSALACFFFFWSVLFRWKLRAFRLPCNPASPGAGAGGLLLLCAQPSLALPSFTDVSSPFALTSSFLFLLGFSPPLAHLYPVFICSVHWPGVLMIRKKLSCSGLSRVMISMPLSISSPPCKVHTRPNFEIPLGAGRWLLLSALSLYCICKHGCIHSLARNTVYDN